MNLRAISFAALLALAACAGTEETHTPEPAPAPAPPPPAPPPPKADVMDVAALNAAKDANVGQMVKVKGFLTEVAKTDTATTATISATAEGGEAVWCVADAAAEPDMTAALKTEVTVSGTVAVADGKTQLTGCTLAGGKEGKAGKAAEGGDDAKAGKGGKGGKQKAH